MSLQVSFQHRNVSPCTDDACVHDDGTPEILMVACGGAHTAALTCAGRLWTWGEGGWGQLGNSDGRDSLSPNMVAPRLFEGARVMMIACGGGHTCAICDCGKVWTWGSGLWGQLGNDSRTDRLVPGQVPSLEAVYVACGYGPLTNVRAQEQTKNKQKRTQTQKHIRLPASISSHRPTAHPRLLRRGSPPSCV